jgi:hypothetical protein
MKAVSIAAVVVAVMSFLAFATTRTVCFIAFDRNIGGYLERAAGANTVDLARQNLGVAVEAARNAGYTSGYTSIVYTTPDEDVGYWFTNLSAALSELSTVKPDASMLERSNVLMKLRETLMGASHTQVIVPMGVSVFPHNAAFLWWGLLSFLAIPFFGILVVAEFGPYDI